MDNKLKCLDLVSVYLSICLSVYPSHSPLKLTISSVSLLQITRVLTDSFVEGGLYVYLSICMSIYPSVCMSIYLTVSLSVCIPIHLYKYKCRNIALWKNEKAKRKGKKKRKVQNKLFIQI